MTALCCPPKMLRLYNLQWILPTYLFLQNYIRICLHIIVRMQYDAKSNIYKMKRSFIGLITGHLHLLEFANSVEQRPSTEPDSSSANQEMNLLWNNVRRNSPLGTVMREVNPITSVYAIYLRSIIIFFNLRLGLPCPFRVSG
jgi:hypothetical protein